MYDFKQICIDNTIKLNKYASKLSNVPGVFTKNNLIINLKIDELLTNSNEQDLSKTEDYSAELEKIDTNPQTTTLVIDAINSTTLPTTNTAVNISQSSVNSKEISMYSVSLNQWDSFETKYTCRCIKEFSSFTENTKHLCKNCEGELLGFRLSKIKAGVADSRFSTNIPNIKTEVEETVSDDINSEFSDSDNTSDDSEEDGERGFDENDILLCNLHINAVKKQIHRLENNINFQQNSDPFENISHECDDCGETFLNKFYFEKHKLINCIIKEESYSTSTHTSTTSRSLQIDEGQSDLEEDEHDLSKSSKNSDLNSSGEIRACGTCDKVFTSKGKLAIHLMTHVGRKEYKCPKCYKEFFRKDNLDTHLKTHEITYHTTQDSEDQKYKCPCCYKDFNNFINVRRHVRETHNIKRYCCIICDQIFDDKFKLNQHMFVKHTLYDNEHGINKYQCPLCHKNYFRTWHVRRHIRETHNYTSFRCFICKLVFDEKHLLDKHILYEHNENELSIDEDDDYQEEQERTISPFVPSPSPSPTPSSSPPPPPRKKFRRSRATPMKFLQVNDRFQCPECDKSYTLQTNVYRHYKTHHKLQNEHFADEDEQHGYDDDDQEEKKEEDDDDEEYKQVEPKKFSCLKCDKAYHHISSVRRHMQEFHGIKKFVCNFCNDMFDDRQILKKHIYQIHRYRKPTVNFEGKDEREHEPQLEEMNHGQTEDFQTPTNEKKYKCAYCDKRYYHHYHVRRHMKEIHGVNKYICVYCNSVFDGKQILKEHICTLNKTMNSEDEDEPQPRDMINQSQNEDLQPQKSEKKYKCAYCEKRYYHHNHVRRHMLEIHGVNKFSCVYCHNVFDDSRTLKEHIIKSHKTLNSEDEREHVPQPQPKSQPQEINHSQIEDFQTPANEKKFKCAYCEKRYYHHHHVRRHMIESHGINKFSCVYCHDVFDDRQTLKEHILKLHKTVSSEDEDEREPDLQSQEINQQTEDSPVEENEKRFKCSYCNKAYNHLSNLRRHLREAHDVEKYLCSICNETFVDKRILEEHIFNAHTQGENKTNSPTDTDKQKRFSCPVCNKNFNHLSNLRMHALSHTDTNDSPAEYNFCHICKKHISKRSSMHRHLMTHTKGQVYNCCACPAKFDNRWVLRQHMRSIHPDFGPDFKCIDCFKVFTSKSYLQKHRRIHTK